MKRDASNESWARVIPYILIVVVGCGLSFLLFFVIDHQENIELQSHFEHIAQNRASSLYKEIDHQIQILESVRYFFESSQVVERQEFARFTSSFWGSSNGFRAISWAPRIMHNDRSKFEASEPVIDGDVFYIKEYLDGQLFPASEREEYFPIYYVEPFAENRIAWGYDVFSEPMRRHALIEARDNDTMSITEGLRLVVEAQEDLSYLIFNPIYKKNLPIETVQDRRQNLEGFVLGAIHIQHLVEYAMSLSDIQGVSVYLCDLSASPGHRSLAYYTHGRCDMSQLPDNLADGSLPESVYWKTNYNIGTRQWTIICLPEAEMIAFYRTWNPWAVMFIGLLVTFFAYGYYWNTRRRTQAIEQLVEIRTEELNEELLQRKRTEKELAQLTKSLQVKNAELESVVYIASHDLKSPLVNISGFGQELHNNCNQLKAHLMHRLSDQTLDQILDQTMISLLDEAIPESLQFILSGVDKMNQLINGLLQLSRVGTSEFQIEKLDMNEMIAEVISNNSFLIKQCGAVITTDPLPLCRGDKDKTNQVFSNLISNALKYLSSDRPGMIHISGWVESDNSIYCVEDNGIGIAPHQQEKIFQIFQRAVGSDIEGEGLGLAVVVRILDCQKGEIWLESEEGKSSKFFVSLPSA